jgi:eukaryotic-like serine/threonine-protein kinase
MHEHVTLLAPEAPSPGARRTWSSLPPDLLDQVRARIRLLALLMMIGFGLDPLLFFGGWVAISLNEGSPPPEFFRDAFFYWGDITVVAASAALWWIARNPRVSVNRLSALGILYEVSICFVLSVRTFWEYYRDTGMLPNLTWVPAVIILFPLILPAPPRLMLAAAIAAGATSPLALLLLELTGKIQVGADAYINTTIGAGIAVGFAYMGARVVYRLGREVAAARELGSYRLEERLGQGGMGEVWRARHRMLARPAAIKLIHPALIGPGGNGASTDLAQRFEREAQVIARLRSPHTVDLFDFGVADNGAFYYVMELLEGLDGDRLVRKFGPLPAERAIFLLCQICHSLSEAESYGLVHRDIKPANIFLCRYGEDYDFVKVLDFGLVKAFQDKQDPEPALTRENMVQGTPAFIAPEQALGRSSLDSRVDIYALGCVAYWFVTGQLVFTAENSVGLLLHHVHTQPTRPSARTDLSIPPDLDDLILACLAKNPADRPQSARELSRRLGEIQGVNQWTQDRARQWWVRHQPVRELRAKEPASIGAASAS